MEETAHIDTKIITFEDELYLTINISNVKSTKAVLPGVTPVLLL